VLQLKNHSPFEATLGLFPNEQGVDSVYVVVKATFDIGPKLSIAEKQVPIVLADEYWGEPAQSSIKYASEVHLTKPSTDVVLVGRACVPDDRKATQLDVRLAVAERQKALRVFGNRVWRHGQASSPEPFSYVPIVYEYAFGGIHEIDPENGKFLAEARNPIGCGFKGKRSSGELNGTPLPNVEDPRCLITSAGDKAVPAGYGFIAPTWQPRISFAGTYDETWQKKRAPYLPHDFDSRFFNAASPELVFDRYLQGGEPVMIDNLGPHGPVRINLPICKLNVAIRIAGKVEPSQMNLETVLVEPEQPRLCMTWRGSATCDKKMLKVEQIDVQLNSIEFPEGGV
jgi:hypothetical protein